VPAFAPAVGVTQTKEAYHGNTDLELRLVHQSAPVVKAKDLTAPEPLDDAPPSMTEAEITISPVAAARALAPRRMQNIRDFDALEIVPSRLIGHYRLGDDIVEPCHDPPEEVAFWTVYGTLPSVVY
jgi:hypothetical protein